MELNALAHDQAAISAVIDRLYSAALNPDQWASALDSFAMVTGGIGALLFSPDRPEPNITYFSPSLTDAATQYAQLWHQVCPRTSAGLNPALGDRSWSDEDVFSPDKMTRSAFHQDFLRRYDLGTQLTLSSRQLVPGSTFFLASQRTRSADLPSPEERKAMEVLSSHAIRALQVYRSVASPQLSRELLSDVLAHLPTGIIVTDHNSRVVFMNRQAEALDGDGFRVDRGQIFASMLRDQPALTQLIADTAASRVKAAEVRPVVLQRPSLRKPLVIRAVPISGKSDRPLAHVLRGLDLVLLTISDPEGVSDGAPLDELVALGLTATEAVIAFMLGTGSSPEEIAEVREIALSTVRTHIRRIYSKFHIARQGELAKIVSAIKRVI